MLCNNCKHEFPRREAGEILARSAEVEVAQVRVLRCPACGSVDIQLGSIEPVELPEGLQVFVEKMADKMMSHHVYCIRHPVSGVRGSSRDIAFACRETLEEIAKYYKLPAEIEEMMAKLANQELPPNWQRWGQDPW